MQCATQLKLNRIATVSSIIFPFLKIILNPVNLRSNKKPPPKTVGEQLKTEAIKGSSFGYFD
jgi:hypothetical protein